MPGAMRRTTRWILRRLWPGAVAAVVLIAVLAEPRAEPAPGEAALVLAADTTLGDAMRAGDAAGLDCAREGPTAKVADPVELNRRDVLRLGAWGLGGAAVAPLLGACGPGDSSAPGAGSTTSVHLDPFDATLPAGEPTGLARRGMGRWCT